MTMQAEPTCDLMPQNNRGESCRQLFSLCEAQTPVVLPCRRCSPISLCFAPRHTNIILPTCFLSLSLLPGARLIVQAGSVALVHLHPPTEPAAACVSGDVPRVQHLQVCVDADTVRFDVCVTPGGHQCLRLPHSVRWSTLSHADRAIMLVESF